MEAGAPERLPCITIERGNFSDTSRDGRILQCVVQSAGLSLSWAQYSTAMLLKMAGAVELDIVYPWGFNPQRDVDMKRSLFKIVESGRIAAIAVPEPIVIAMQPNLAWTPQVQTYLEREVGFYVFKTLDPGVLERINGAIPNCRR